MTSVTSATSQSTPASALRLEILQSPGAAAGYLRRSKLPGPYICTKLAPSMMKLQAQVESPAAVTQQPPSCRVQRHHLFSNV